MKTSNTPSDFTRLTALYSTMSYHRTRGHIVPPSLTRSIAEAHTHLSRNTKPHTIRRQITRLLRQSRNKPPTHFLYIANLREHLK